MSKKGKMSDKKVKINWAELWLKEDYWAIWLGLLLLIMGIIIFIPDPPQGMADKILNSNSTMDAEVNRSPFKTIAYYEAPVLRGGD